MKLDTSDLIKDSCTSALPLSTIEIIGSSGVGKSTLLQTLCRKSDRLQGGIGLSKWQTLPEWIDVLKFGLTTYLPEPNSTRWFSRTELRSMVYLDAWYRASERPHNRDRAVVWDQGPIYRLAMLQEFGPQLMNRPQSERWWNDRLERWAAKLDLVVWLDAPDRILLERVYTRNRGHEIKNKSPEEGYEFLRRYRQTAGRILDRLVVERGLKVLRYDTSAATADRIADRVLDTLNISSIV